MFDTKHYVPILKWKFAERKALEKLSPEQKLFITPLIQIVMPPAKPPKNGEREKSPKEQLEESIGILKNKMPTISEEILKSWGTSPAFVDLCLVDKSLKELGFTTIFTTGKKLGISLIPTVSLSSDVAIQEVVLSIAKRNKTGVCLRLFRSDFSSQTALSENLKNFFDTYDFSEDEVDLLIDFQISDELCANLAGFIEQIPNLLKWRTFTFGCGHFPVDLSSCKLGINFIERLDWKNWVNQINSSKLRRKPSFADYTIQHPIYKDVSGLYPSASIRYTLDDEWLVMRGQKKKNVQYLANAQLLSKHPKFFGMSFSYGDAYIAEKGRDLKSDKTGNATTWLVAGINHHLVCTVSQIANLT